jgi:hypothetical protein
VLDAIESCTSGRVEDFEVFGGLNLIKVFFFFSLSAEINVVSISTKRQVSLKSSRSPDKHHSNVRLTTKLKVLFNTM